MFSNITSYKTVGIDAVPVKIEAEVRPGIGIHLVGLADMYVKESLLRTITAMQALGYRIPGKKMIINLSPSDLHKSGSGYDLPIALGLLEASEQKTFKDADKFLIAGELGLDGSVRAVSGAVQAAKMAEKEGLSLILPEENAKEILPFFGHLTIYGIKNMNEAVSILEERPCPTISKKEEASSGKEKPEDEAWKLIYGNEGARRAIEIAAAGGHDIILVGPPGSQKSTIARALRELLPEMTHDEAIETASVYSAAGNWQTRHRNETVRPFRAPHYSASMSALFGGGTGDAVLPGEVSLAHNGILYLDEFNMFPKSVMEALRGPLEDGKVKISRLRNITEYPARFQLAASMLPCPCGYHGTERCTCTPGQIATYLSRIFTPVYDRIDIQVYTQAVPEKIQKSTVEDIDAVRGRILEARKKQFERFGTLSKLNANMTSADIEKYIKIDDNVKDLLEKLMDRLGLSARTYTRILKVARTIADLAGCETVNTGHVAEAAGYRFLDRTNK